MTKTRQLGIDQMLKDIKKRRPAIVTQNEEVAQRLLEKKIRKELKGRRVKAHNRERTYK